MNEQEKQKTLSFTHTMTESMYLDLFRIVKTSGHYKNVQDLLNKLASDFLKNSLINK